MNLFLINWSGKGRKCLPCFVQLFLLVFNLREFNCTHNPYRHTEILDAKGNYRLQWEFREASSIIIFNITAKTSGWVGLGLGRSSSMSDADMVVGGVYPSGQPFLIDMYTTGNRSLEMDLRQDWNLIAAWEESGGVTHLSISRLLETCDDNDHKITSDFTWILWAFGENDTLGYHYHNRGTLGTYLLDYTPNSDIFQKPQATSTVQSWTLRRRIRLTNKPTTYFCSIHKGPELSQKHHVIGFRTILENELARRHTHHILVYRCHAPEGVDPRILFEPFVNYSGEECYLNENKRLPLFFCRDFYTVWGTGGEPVLLPETVGFPLGDIQTEYMFFETHFDNQELRSDLEFEVGVELLISSKLRDREGRVIVVGFDSSGSLAAFPPGSLNFNLIGQCDPNCTQTMFPPGGVNVVAAMLHSHTTAIRMRLQHFRQNRELPWIIKDDSYNPRTQQMRHLPHEVKILPGDHLVSRCVFDNTRTNGTTTTGFGTHQEMCMTFLILDTRIPYYRCTSEYPARDLLSTFGVQEVIWDIQNQERIVNSPESRRGLTLRQIGDDFINWTSKMRMELENDLMYSPHIMDCPTHRIPSAEEILLTSQQAQQFPPNPVPEAPLEQELRQLRVKWHWDTRHKSQQTSQTNASIPQVTSKNYDPALQQEIQDAVSQVRENGIRQLTRLERSGAIIMLAAVGPLFPQGLPATGISGFGIAPSASFPRGSHEYRPPPSRCLHMHPFLFPNPSFHYGFLPSFYDSLQ